MLLSLSGMPILFFRLQQISRDANLTCDHLTSLVNIMLKAVARLSIVTGLVGVVNASIAQVEENPSPVGVEASPSPATDGSSALSHTDQDTEPVVHASEQAGTLESVPTQPAGPDAQSVVNEPDIPAVVILTHYSADVAPDAGQVGAPDQVDTTVLSNPELVELLQDAAPLAEYLSEMLVADSSNSEGNESVDAAVAPVQVLIVVAAEVPQSGLADVLVGDAESADGSTNTQPDDEVDEVATITDDVLADDEDVPVTTDEVQADDKDVVPADESTDSDPEDSLDEDEGDSDDEHQTDAELAASTPVPAGATTQPQRAGVRGLFEWCDRRCLRRSKSSST